MRFANKQIKIFCKETHVFCKGESTTSFLIGSHEEDPVVLHVIPRFYALLLQYITATCVSGINIGLASLNRDVSAEEAYSRA